MPNSFISSTYSNSNNIKNWNSSNTNSQKEQRKCFLIDTLLEQSQKRLETASADENHNKQIKRENFKNKIEQQNYQKQWERNEIINIKEENNEETLPSPCHFEVQNEEENEEENKKLKIKKEEKNEEECDERKSLLDALMKLLPVVQSQSTSDNNLNLISTENESKRKQILLSSPQNDHQNLLSQQQPEQHQKMAIAATTAAAASMEFLQRIRLFQQHLSPNNAQVFQHNSITKQFAENTQNSGPFPSIAELNSLSSLNFQFHFPHHELPKNTNIFQLKPSINLIQQQSLCWQQFLTTASVLRQNPMQTLIFANQEIVKRRILEKNLNNRNERKNLANNHFNATCSNITIPLANKLKYNNQHNNNVRERSTAGTSEKSKRQNKIDLRKKIQNRIQHSSTTNGRIGTRSSNVKKYKCDICEKTFSRSNTLITHKRIHTGEKPFRCDHCGRAFRQPGNLTRHAYTHTTVKPFVCNECGKAFNRSSNLQTHIRVHQQVSEAATSTK